MIKKCKHCKKRYNQLAKKGSSRAKYCYKCRPIVRKLQMKKSEAKREERRLAQNGYIIPKDEETFFYGYKEPLTKFEGGYGYRGVVLYSKGKDKVQCHFCGRLFKNVGVHAANKHGIGQREYKERTGLNYTTALIGEGTRETMIEAHTGIHHKNKTKEELRRHMIKMSKVAQKNGRMGNGGWKNEKRNEHGSCPEQLIDKIKRLQEKVGRRPTSKEYVKEYGSYQAIMTVYGTWEKAMKMAKIRTYKEEKSEKSSKEFLIRHLQLFYDRYNRTPRQSDFRRGLLPHHQIYYNVFGNLNNARRAAGIPELIDLGGRRWIETKV